jgi:hypothetical protein
MMVLYTGVNELLERFVQSGWTFNGLISSEEGITYYKEGHELEYFELRYNHISGSEEPIYVSVPLKNSTYQYVLYFKEFETATNYISKMFHEYTNTVVPIS